MAEPGGTVNEFELRNAISAVLHGVVMRGFDGPDGVSKDEALEYAAVLAEYVQTQLGRS